ncbi:MAG: methylmalonyl-CoA epimerase [Acidobacteria bacterium]|nr:methylmalonyl-CoA epimerase [Acidobacteriota bacterium]
MKATLDHVGIAVGDLGEALAFYREALGIEVEATEDVPSQGVRAHFLRVGSASLELLEATTESGPIGRYLARRGPGLHHLTLRVDDIRAALRAVAARGAKLIDTEPREGAEGALVAFIHPSSAHGVLVELKQERADSRELAPQNANEVRAAEQAPGTVGAGADPEPATGWRR